MLLLSLVVLSLLRLVLVAGLPKSQPDQGLVATTGSQLNNIAEQEIFIKITKIRLKSIQMLSSALPEPRRCHPYSTI